MFRVAVSSAPILFAETIELFFLAQAVFAMEDEDGRRSGHQRGDLAVTRANTMHGERTDDGQAQLASLDGGDL